MACKYQSPNGDDIIGTADTVKVTARISGINDDGSPEYEGGSDIDWDSQTTDERKGKPVFLCESGDRWTFDQLVKVEEENDE